MTDASYVFLDRHIPGLQAGQYKVLPVLDVGADARCAPVVDFFVGGARFGLTPADIHSVYPPLGSRGAFLPTLPHVALSRDTLPWERRASDGSPWLALILLPADSQPPTTITLASYRARLGPALAPEPDEEPGDQVQVLELPLTLAQQLIPSNEARERLCHVRGRAEQHSVEGSVAVVLSGRCPTVGRNTAYLVSLEARAPASGGSIAGGGRLDSLQTGKGKLDDLLSSPLADADNPNRCTVATLWSWSFTCQDANTPGDESLSHLFKDLSLAWLRVPAEPEFAAAESHLSRGRTPLPHQFRTGESAASWYAGPLAPGLRTEPVLKLPANSSDALLFFEPKLGMLDVTYAAAWELGRLRVLESPELEHALSSWRRERVLGQRLDKEKASAHLPQVQRALAQKREVPKLLSDWIRDLWRLDAVPFRYLVPDERMLPNESFRFFALDRSWLKAMLDGVLSLARPPKLSERDAQAEQELTVAVGWPEKIAGFLLRSAVVSGWPDIVVTASDGSAAAHRIQFAPSIVLYLFTQQIGGVVLRQHDATLHHHADSLTPSFPLDYPSASALARGSLAEAQELEVTANW